MANRIAVMDRGRIAQIGTPAEIYYRPASKFVADFIGESNFLDVDSSRASSGVVQLDDGRGVPCRADGWHGGARATLMVRPESVHIGRPEDGADSSLRGRVVQSSFLGSQTRVAVRCEGVETPLVAAQFGRERLAALDLTPDREVALWWDSSDAVLLSNEPTKEE